MHKRRLSFFLSINKMYASAELIKCLIHFFAKASFRYHFKIINSMFKKLYNNSYNDFAMILIA